jgi:molybdopterin-guanine dinucleotide biosynthesis protein A
MRLSAVLLAGGQSRRMGENKALITVRGKPLWRIQIELLRRLKPHEILVSARFDPPWRPKDVRFVGDDRPSRGPLSGLAAAMTQMRGSHLIALAVDMPFMNETFLRSLCRKIELGCGVLPMIGKRAEPLAAIYPAEIYSDLIAALSGTDFSLQTLTKKLIRAEKLRVIKITQREEKLFYNINYPADLGDCVSP